MMLLHLLLSLIGVVLVALTLPLVVEVFVLSVAAALPQRLRANTAAASFRVFVIVPAHNEQQLIAACVKSLLASTEGAAEVCVIAHNCTDGTAAAASAAGATVLELNDSGTGGKGAALYFGFAHALASGADAVLVIDADSTVSKTLIAVFRRAFSSGAAALQCRYIAANAAATVRTRLMSLSLLGMNVLRPRGRSKLGLSCGIFGNGFALSATTLRTVPYAAHSVVEDLEYHLLLLKAGLRVDFLDDAEVIGEMPTASGASATQRARWEGGRMLMRRTWALPLARDVLRGSVGMLEPLLDLLALPLASGTGLLILALVLPVHWLREYASLGLGAVVLYILVAALLGEEPVATLAAVVAAPAYMLWKLSTRGQTRRIAQGDAAWVRTERNAAEDDRKPS